MLSYYMEMMHIEPKYLTATNYTKFCENLTSTIILWQVSIPTEEPNLILKVL